MMNYVRELFGSERKIREILSCTPTLSVGLVGCLELLGVYERATGPHGRALYGCVAG